MKSKLDSLRYKFKREKLRVGSGRAKQKSKRVKIRHINNDGRVCPDHMVEDDTLEKTTLQSMGYP